MKVHMKYIYCYKFETKLLLITNRKLGKLGESKFIHMTVNGGGLSCLRPLFAVNAPNRRVID